MAEDSGRFSGLIPDAPSVSWSDVAPGWIRRNSDFLRTFANRPRETIMGVILSAIVGGLLDIWTQFLDALTWILWGDYATSTAGAVGLADIPLLAVELVTGATAPVGSSILGAVDGLFDSLSGMLSGLGLAAFPVGVALVVVTLVVIERLVRNVGLATISSIPIVGPALEVLLR